jgi:hypothetical protein
MIGGLEQVLRALASRDHHFDVAGTPDGRIFILIIGGLLVGHLAARDGPGRIQVRPDLAVAVVGFIVKGQVMAQMPDVDDDGDVHWTVRVCGTAPDGTRRSTKSSRPGGARRLR